MTVTKHALIETLLREIGASGTPISKTQIAAVLEHLGSVTHRALGLGHDVILPGIGRLKVNERAARPGISPQGKPIEIPAKRLVKLTTAKALDSHLNP